MIGLGKQQAAGEVRRVPGQLAVRQLDARHLLGDRPRFRWRREDVAAQEFSSRSHIEPSYRRLVDEQEVPEGEVIFVGEPLGGAIATELARWHASRLLVLHGAFTSVPDMA